MFISHLKRSHKTADRAHKPSTSYKSCRETEYVRKSPRFAFHAHEISFLAVGKTFNFPCLLTSSPCIALEARFLWEISNKKYAFRKQKQKKKKEVKVGGCRLKFREHESAGIYNIFQNDELDLEFYLFNATETTQSFEYLSDTFFHVIFYEILHKKIRSLVITGAATEE